MSFIDHLEALRWHIMRAVLAVLVLAAVITPSPDWGSQMIVCIPLVLLYEISVIIAARVSKKNEKSGKNGVKRGYQL